MYIQPLSGITWTDVRDVLEETVLRACGSAQKDRLCTPPHGCDQCAWNSVENFMAYLKEIEER